MEGWSWIHDPNDCNIERNDAWIYDGLCLVGNLHWCIRNSDDCFQCAKEQLWSPPVKYPLPSRLLCLENIQRKSIKATNNSLLNIKAKIIQCPHCGKQQFGPFRIKHVNVEGPSISSIYLYPCRLRIWCLWVRRQWNGRALFLVYNKG